MSKDLFIKLVKNALTFELLNNSPDAFLLLTYIAFRTKRDDSYSSKGLKAGQAFIKSNDHACGLSRKKHRQAREVLEEIGLVKFERRPSGSFATILTKSVFDLNLTRKNNLGPTEGQQMGHQKCNINNTETESYKEENEVEGQRFGQDRAIPHIYIKEYKNSSSFEEGEEELFSEIKQNFTDHQKSELIDLSRKTGVCLKSALRKMERSDPAIPFLWLTKVLNQGVFEDHQDLISKNTNWIESIADQFDSLELVHDISNCNIKNTKLLEVGTRDNGHRYHFDLSRKDLQNQVHEYLTKRKSNLREILCLMKKK